MGFKINKVEIHAILDEWHRAALGGALEFERERIELQNRKLRCVVEKAFYDMPRKVLQNKNPRR